MKYWQTLFGLALKDIMLPNLGGGGGGYEGPISSYLQGHLQQNECKFSAKYACAFFTCTIYKAIVPNEIHGE